jgi:hypothetical protein
MSNQGSCQSIDRSMAVDDLLKLGDISELNHSTDCAR